MRGRCLSDVPPLVAASPNNANINRAMGVKVAKESASAKGSPAGAGAGGGPPVAGTNATAAPDGAAPKPRGTRLSASALRRGV